jgi:hypothetical protein
MKTSAYIILGTVLFLFHTVSVQAKSYTEAEAKILTSVRAHDVVAALHDQDFKKLATLTHPQKGIHFSLNAFIGSEEIILGAKEIIDVNKNDKKYTWGIHDGADEPTVLSFQDYFKTFVYNQDFLHVKEVGYNRIIRESNTLNNIKEYYPSTIFVEYHFPGSDPELGGLDWASLRLVFEEYKGVWYLMAIVHDHWTI